MDGTVVAARHQVAAQELRQPFQGRLADISLQATKALGREVADRTAVAVECLSSP
jgi:hypothetical protein